MKEQSRYSYSKVLKQLSTSVSHKNGRGEGGDEQLGSQSNYFNYSRSIWLLTINVQIPVDGNPFTILVSLSVHKVVGIPQIMICKDLSWIKGSKMWETLTLSRHKLSFIKSLL